MPSGWQHFGKLHAFPVTRHWFYARILLPQPCRYIWFASISDLGSQGDSNIAAASVAYNTAPSETQTQGSEWITDNGNKALLALFPNKASYRIPPQKLALITISSPSGSCASSASSNQKLKEEGKNHL